MSERFLLDTNIISESVMQGRDSVVLGLIAQVGEDSICTGAIFASEMRFGVERKGSQALREKVERALPNILPYNSGRSQSYGFIRATLKRRARGSDATIVRSFDGGDGLRVVNCFDPSYPQLVAH
uniref:hypothetical protein n=1 Tax=Methylobacterium sp. B34 TaxID=95563 RepID=UPI000349F808|nr:hypothetical protein [Methylobacterium sp. B34]